jgi:hypothetical protein
VGWRQRVPVLAAALWWGSLTTLGFLVVPLLFKHLPTPALAGQTAAKLFTAQTWVSLGCGLLVLLGARSGGDQPRLDWGRGAIGFVLAGLLLALLVEFGVAPRIVARENLRLWHSLGSGMYALQWLCALVVLWKVTGERSAAGHPGERRDPDPGSERSAAGHPRAGGDPGPGSARSAAGHPGERRDPAPLNPGGPS